MYASCEISGQKLGPSKPTMFCINLVSQRFSVKFNEFTYHLIRTVFISRGRSLFSLTVDFRHFLFHSFSYQLPSSSNHSCITYGNALTQGTVNINSFCTSLYFEIHLFYCDILVESCLSSSGHSLCLPSR